MIRNHNLSGAVFVAILFITKTNTKDSKMTGDQLYYKWAAYSLSMGGKPKEWYDLPEVQRRAWNKLAKELEGNKE